MSAAAPTSIGKNRLIRMAEAPSAPPQSVPGPVSSNRRASIAPRSQGPWKAACLLHDWAFYRGTAYSPGTPPLAAAVGGVAPRRDQQRHVIMSFRLGEREPHRHNVEKRRIALSHVQAGKVVANVETQLITADRQWTSPDQRFVRTPLAIGPHS